MNCFVKRKGIIILFLIFVVLIILLDRINKDKKTQSNRIIEEKNKNIEIQCFDIPIVILEGNILDIEDKSEERKIKLEYKDRNKNLEFETNAEIKWQGQSSLKYDKKNYTINLYKDENCEEKRHIDMGQGWGEYYKYCLKANWIDTRTHARNIVSAQLSAEVQAKYNLFENTPNNGTIDGYPVVVYINNEFHGIYTLNIPKSDWLWGVDEENPNNIALFGEIPKKAGLFMEEIKTWEKDIAEWECEVGEENQETIDKFNRVINFVKDSTDEKFIEEFEEYINKDSMLNYIVMIYWINGTDNLSRNMAMVTYDGKVWYPTLYDLDGTFGINPHGGETTNYVKNLEQERSLLFSRVSSLFKKEIAERYFELRKDILTIENTINKFEAIYNQIPEEYIQKEKEKWNNPNQSDINQVREYLEKRVQYLDEFMGENLK